MDNYSKSSYDRKQASKYFERNARSSYVKHNIDDSNISVLVPD